MTQLRSKAHETGVFVKVVKNTLARRALAGTEFECVSESLTGPLVLAFSIEDPGSAARLVRDFAKDNEKLFFTRQEPPPTALSFLKQENIQFLILNQ